MEALNMSAVNLDGGISLTLVHSNNLTLWVVKYQLSPEASYDSRDLIQYKDIILPV